MNRYDLMSKRPSRTLRAVLTLFGNSNSGKTSTLRYLFYLLAGINTFRKIATPYDDFRVKVLYRETIIVLSTVGDVEEEVELNWMWFRNKWKSDYSKLGLKQERRHAIDFCKDADGNVIAIGPTHVEDEGARVNDMNIINLKPLLSFIGYYQKCKATTSENSFPVTQEQLEVLGKGLSGQMARSAIRTAEMLKKQIDDIIDCLK